MWNFLKFKTNCFFTEKGQKIFNQMNEVFEQKFTRMSRYFEEKEEDFVGMLAEIREILTEGENVKFD